MNLMIMSSVPHLPEAKSERGWPVAPCSHFLPQVHLHHDPFFEIERIIRRHGRPRSVQHDLQLGRKSSARDRSDARTVVMLSLEVGC